MSNPPETLLGIDPGIHGGYAILRNSRIVHADRLPTYTVVTTGTRVLTMVDGHAVGNIAIAHGVTRIAIEDAYGRKGDGPGGSFTFGGIWWTLYGFLKEVAPIVVVRPRVWQKAILGPWRASVSLLTPNGKPRTNREIGKAASVAMCKALHPEVELCPGRCQQPHDGVSDSVGIALWLSTQNDHVSTKDHPPKTLRRPARRRA